MRRKVDTAILQMGQLGFWSLVKPASYVRDIIGGVAQFCLEYSDIDGIIFSGDLATTGIKADIDVAQSFVTAPVAAGFRSASRFPTLTASRTAIHVVAGNHDKYADDYGTPGGVEFDTAFKPQMANYKDGVGYWVQQKLGYVMGFIFADFCIRDPMDASDKLVGLWGQGRVYQDTLEKLVARTTDLQGRYRGIAIVWVVHFAPFDCGYRLWLHEADELIAAAEKLGVVATLCGHTHSADKKPRNKHIVYVAGSAGCVDSENNSRIHVLHFDFDEGCSSSRENFSWNWDRHEFVRDSAD